LLKSKHQASAYTENDQMNGKNVSPRKNIEKKAGMHGGEKQSLEEVKGIIDHCTVTDNYSAP